MRLMKYVIIVLVVIIATTCVILNVNGEQSATKDDGSCLKSKKTDLIYKITHVYRDSYALVLWVEWTPKQDGSEYVSGHWTEDFQTYKKVRVDNETRVVTCPDERPL